MMLYSEKIDADGNKQVSLLGIRIYQKSILKGTIKRTWLRFLFKSIRKNHVVKIYFLGLRIYRKNDYYNFLKDINSKIVDLKLNNLQEINKKLNNLPVIINAPIVHRPFLKFKNFNINKDVVMVGTGPTLKFYEKLENAVHCGVNACVRYCDFIDYLFIEDKFINDPSLHTEINNYRKNQCIKFFGILPPNRLEILNKGRYFTDRICSDDYLKSDAYPFLIEDIVDHNWAIDIDREPFGDFHGAIMSALQFILYTNPKRIFLVGCDCSSGHIYDLDNTEKVNHLGKVRQFIKFKKVVDTVYPHIQVISINPVNLKGLFKDILNSSQFVGL